TDCATRFSRGFRERSDDRTDRGGQQLTRSAAAVANGYEKARRFRGNHADFDIKRAMGSCKTPAGTLAMKRADMRAKVLVVEDREPAAARLTSELEHRRLTSTTADSSAQALSLLGSDGIDVVVACHGSPSEDAHELCRRIVGTRPDVPVVVVSEAATLD